MSQLSQTPLHFGAVYHCDLLSRSLNKLKSAFLKSGAVIVLFTVIHFSQDLKLHHVVFAAKAVIDLHILKQFFLFMR